MQFSPVLRYLALPLRAAPLQLIILFSVLLVIVRYAGLFGLWLGLLLITGFCNYIFKLLDSVVAREAEPPVLSVEMMNPVAGLRSLALLFLAITVFFVSDAAVYWMTPVVATLLAGALLFVLPAVIAVQGVTGSLVQSLNLARCFRLIARLGGDYVLIFICVAFLAMLGYLMVATPLSTMTPLIVRFAYFLYAWLAAFALIGGVIVERRNEIGMHDADEVESFDDIERAAALLEKQREQQIDAIYAEWRGGARSNAWTTIGKLVEKSADPIDELEWLYERASRWPEPFLANRLAQDLVQRLIAAHRYGRALDITRERLRAYADFRPLTGADLIRLARLAATAGDRPAARALLANFQQFYPDDPLRPVADELQAQLAR